MNEQIKELKKEQNRMKRRIQALEHQLEEAEKTIKFYHTWRSGICKGGRKSTLSEEKKQEVILQRRQGLTIRQVAKNVGMSVGAVHKILNDTNNMWL